MVWRSAPNRLVQFRAMLQASAAWLAAGGAQAQIHYPAALVEADSALPRAILYCDIRMEHVATQTTIPRGPVTAIIHAFGRYADLITAADAAADTITVAGDITAQVAAGDEVAVYGSTANDGWYLVDSVSYSAGADATTLAMDTTVRALVDSTADGQLYTGSVEDLADRIADDLMGQETGLPITSAGRQGAASFPEASDGTSMADLYISVTIEAETGLEIGA